MAPVKVLIEVEETQTESFAAFGAALDAPVESERQAGRLLDPVAGLGVDLDEDAIPVPMFSRPGTPFRESDTLHALEDFSSPRENPDMPSTTVVIPVEVDKSRLAELGQREGVLRVWANSELTLYGPGETLFDNATVAEDEGIFDLARSRAGLDCRPFRSGVDIETIRSLLGVASVWNDGFRGQNVAVGIIDEGVNGRVYPVKGGHAREGASRKPGAAPITSHGSMCAADVLIAAPMAMIYDYPFLGVPNSGGALTMFQAVLDQRRLDGTPHVTSNSYGFVNVPRRDLSTGHEIWDSGHPLHRKVREVIGSGAAAFFAAGNCGQDCPSGNCQTSSIGPGKSIHASNSLAEVITVAAVNSRHERIGYSSQGPGMFQQEKPDLACYSHIFGNFGPGRPGGTPPQSPFDNGTSAATPVAAGVAALLLSAFPDLAPGDLRKALLDGLVKVGAAEWDPDYGRGIINAAASYSRMKQAKR